MEAGCSPDRKDRVCRSRGGESCAFDGAMIVLQPIADTAHIVHGPSACCGNSWEGRGSLSSKGTLHRMGFTTDMGEMDIVYGSERKLYGAILKTFEAVNPKAIFVYATCVSGLIGEGIEAICGKTEKMIGVPVIPVNAPGFVGPKNLGNRIAGEVLLNHVIGTGERPEHSTTSPFSQGGLINLIGEYNIAGDLRLVEPLFDEAGMPILSRITGDAAFEEITYAHKAKANVVVCSRALINVAREMEKRYGIPYVEVSFFGKTEMSKALREISRKLSATTYQSTKKVEEIIHREEERLGARLRGYDHLKGKKAVLYTGGVKSWSFISALSDLGIDVVAIGVKKSTFHDEEKMKEILGDDAPIVEDVSPKNLLRLLKEREADILVAGGRNQYLAIKEGYPFVDVNQERHTAYAGYNGLVNLAEQISNGIRFYGRQSAVVRQRQRGGSASVPNESASSSHGEGLKRIEEEHEKTVGRRPEAKDCVVNPLKHSQSMGAAIAFQGVHKAIPVTHGAQGCTFLGKVLLTKHFREPIALSGTKLFAEEVIMGSEENITKVLEEIMDKNSPDLIALLTSGLSEVKGDDISAALRQFNMQHPTSRTVSVRTPDYEGGLETGYAKALEAVIESIVDSPHEMTGNCRHTISGRFINILAGCHLSPADFSELREIVESFGLRPIMLPDLSALDGSRRDISPLAVGGTTIEEISMMGSSEFTIAIGASMEEPARLLMNRFGIEYTVFDSISGLEGSDELMALLSHLGGKGISPKYERQKRVLIDAMRDAHFYYGSRRVCLALEPDLALQTARWLNEMGAEVASAAIPQPSKAVDRIPAGEVIIGDLFSIEGEFDLLISNSHAEDTAARLGIPLYQMGFPVYKMLGNTTRVTIGYAGTLATINEVANCFMKGGH